MSGENTNITMEARFGRINSLLDRLMPVLAPAGITLGILLPVFFLKLRPLVPWLFGVTTLSGALKLKTRDLLRTIKNPLPIILFFLTSHLFMPIIVMTLGRLVFGGDPDTISGYVLIYSAPTAVSGFIWISIYRGDAALSLALILIDTILSPVIVPMTVRLLLGADVVLDMTGMAFSLVGMILIPTIIGVTVNEASRGAVPKIVSPYFNAASKICLILVIAANCAPVAPQIDFSNPRVYVISVMCIGFTALGFICGTLAGVLGRRLGMLGNSPREKQTSIFFATGLRNISAAMTLGTEFFPAAAALPTVLGIVFQQTMSAVMGRLCMGKIPAGKTDGPDNSSGETPAKK